MEELKQAIIVRKDLNFKRREIASQVAKASLKFIIENNEAERAGQLLVSLSNDEVAWLTGSFSQDILCVNTKDQLDDIIFRAEMMGIEAYPVFNSTNPENQIPTCVALGPDEPSVINKLIYGLKPL